MISSHSFASVIYPTSSSCDFRSSSGVASSARFSRFSIFWLNICLLSIIQIHFIPSSLPSVFMPASVSVLFPRRLHLIACKLIRNKISFLMAAYRAELGGQFSFMYIAAVGTHPFPHFRSFIPGIISQHLRQFPEALLMDMLHLRGGGRRNLTRTPKELLIL